ncbi:LysM peptidoglycan-binding domain-containing protein (plasmid) [Photobacterium sp. GJ3]|uniref:LysM peptidoglycan-binding domain-containing protein n=1 Tax=Photobacterium sp. GJ3 TaxID=2829502 RepID=UPI001B8CDDBB|nr:LysM peptidoglycan-binding domain-containing protein [Photobacterium sp. GJ3]QUJ69961.1 LysM peptidoglycan-binding domain-containing protein [Photobacterium sp. GJ3]
MIKLLFTKLTLLMVVFNVSARESGYFIGSNAQVLSTENSIRSEDEVSYGMDINAGYLFNDYLSIEAAYGLDNGLLGGEDFNHGDLHLIGYIPLSDSFRFYLGGGGTSFSGDILASGQVGLKYALADDFDINTGYKFYAKPDSWGKFIESFNIGFVYYFGQKNRNQQVSSSRPAQAEEIKVEQVIVQSVPKEESLRTSVLNCIESSSRNLIVHTVKEGEWLLKIRRKYQMTLSEFMNLNQGYINHLKNKNIIQPGDKIRVYHETHTEVCR